MLLIAVTFDFLPTLPTDLVFRPELRPKQFKPSFNLFLILGFKVIIHEKGRSFLALFQLLRFDVTVDMNFLSANPSPSEHAVDGVFGSDIDPPDKVDAALPDSPLDDLGLSSLYEALELLDLFV